VFSTSAIDLFASALGAFILLVMLLFPFYQHAGPHSEPSGTAELIQNRRQAVRAAADMMADSATTETKIAELQARAAEGRAIRLPRPDPADFEWPPVDAGSEADVLVADTVLWAATWLQLRNLAARIEGDRVLHYLEPTAELGWRRAVHRIGRPLCHRLVGHHFERDIPADLRAAGLVVTEMTRFGTGPGQLWSYVIGRAERP